MVCLEEKEREPDVFLLIENIGLAFESIKANKMRSALTMLGIIIGISAVIAINTLGNALSESISNSMSKMGASNINVGLEMKDEDDETTSSGMVFRRGRSMREKTDDDYFTVDMVDDLKNNFSDKIKDYCYQKELGTGTINIQGEYANVSVVGVNEDYFTVNNTFESNNIVAGSEISSRAFDESRSVCLVDVAVCDNLFNGDYEASIGKELEVTIGTKYYTFVICGVMESEYKDQFMSSSSYDQQTTLYAPVGNIFNKVHSDGFEQFTLAVNYEQIEDSDAFIEEIKDYLDKYYHNNKYWQPSAYSMESLVSSLTTMVNGVALVISCVAAIALIVGGIGVMNIMLVSISERTREIGTRKALGASNNSIRTQFIVESVVLCIIGGIIGVVLGYIFGIIGISMFNNMQSLTGSEKMVASPSVLSIVIAVAFSFFVGIFFGYYPANKAAKMNPIDALRYE